MSEEKKKATQKSDQKPKTSIAQSLSFRNLEADEIDVRVARCTATEVELLLYKDARCDMNILDETVGPLNWTRDHKEIKGILFCAIGIWDKEKAEWIYKMDCGTESDMEPVKGASSDAFKRAGFNWSIGRELYSVPRIKTKTASIVPKNSKYACYDQFRVEHIKTTEDKKITELIIYNETKKARAFAWSKTKGVIEL